MATFSASLGTGGSFVALSKKQADGTLYSVAYKALLADQAGAGLPNIVSSVASSQGVFDNGLSNLDYSYQKLKEHIIRVAPSTYKTEMGGFYVNTALTPAQVLAIMHSGDIVTGFLAHASTVALDFGADSALLDSLI